MGNIMTRRSASIQPTPPLPLPPRLQCEFEQAADLALFLYRADQRVRGTRVGDLDERTGAQVEARARVAIRLGDPINVAGAVQAATAAILIDIADRVGRGQCSAAPADECAHYGEALRLAKVAYEAAFNHLAALHLVGREVK